MEDKDGEGCRWKIKMTKGVEGGGEIKKQQRVKEGKMKKKSDSHKK